MMIMRTTKASTMILDDQAEGDGGGYCHRGGREAAKMSGHDRGGRDEDRGRLGEATDDRFFR